MKISKSTALKIQKAIDAKFGIETALYPAEHENLPTGSWSLAYEGWDSDTPWTYTASSLQFENGDFYPSTVFLEPMNSWSLAMYPSAD